MGIPCAGAVPVLHFVDRLSLAQDRHYSSNKRERRETGPY